ncbi:hypothetical protein EJ06DRAFT_529965 [Trichodelitschia bisporula]|uniref:Uncharacterized protein n=1 Tax=Trichodelitschia bisporula TaxID=703511 RepID=A0A6G1HXT8_9PEZI|nr:hypothetical protein EJ06DRAFT_529965 [Trichodelitschia bisporula]
MPGAALPPITRIRRLTPLRTPHRVRWCCDTRCHCRVPLPVPEGVVCAPRSSPSRPPRCYALAKRKAQSGGALPGSKQCGDTPPMLDPNHEVSPLVGDKGRSVARRALTYTLSYTASARLISRVADILTSLANQASSRLRIHKGALARMFFG